LVVTINSRVQFTVVSENVIIFHAIPKARKLHSRRRREIHRIPSVIHYLLASSSFNSFLAFSATRSKHGSTATFATTNPTIAVNKINTAVGAVEVGTTPNKSGSNARLKVTSFVTGTVINNAEAESTPVHTPEMRA
jgi:hypothetical protein